MTAPPPGWIEVNRRMWDERVPVHVGSDFYDVAGFKAGHPRVEPFEVDELGPLGGLRLAHLQCHFGLDTLDLVRMHPTLEAVGLDFSAPAVEAAAQLATDIDVADRVEFVHADVHDAVDTLGAGGFDVVYTGKGALCWLPDLRHWAEQCAGLLRPGGWLYVCEFHPVGNGLAQDHPVVAVDYFDTSQITDETVGTYADFSAHTINNLSYEWPHPLPQVFEAILGVGFQLRFFHEWDYTLFHLNNWLVEGRDGRYRWPGPGRLPLMYSLKAQKEYAQKE
ncbi:MAG TPA: class I SAM-dependent methyltransferase [Acidimicrobiales bacterium]